MNKLYAQTKRYSSNVEVTFDFNDKTPEFSEYASFYFDLDNLEADDLYCTEEAIDELEACTSPAEVKKWHKLNYLYARAYFV